MTIQLRQPDSFSGVVIDAQKGRSAVLAPSEAVETADSLEVVFSDSVVFARNCKTDR